MEEINTLCEQKLNGIKETARIKQLGVFVSEQILHATY